MEKNDMWKVKKKWQQGTIKVGQTGETELVISDRLSKDSIISVEVEYLIEKEHWFLPDAKYFIVPDGSQCLLPIPLPPYKSELTFPIYYLAGENPVLKVKTFSIFQKTRVNITRIKYRTIDTRDDTVKYMFNKGGCGYWSPLFHK